MTRFSTTKLTAEQFWAVLPEYVDNIAGLLDLSSEAEKALVAYLAKNCLSEHPALDITNGVNNQAFKNARMFYLQEVDSIQTESVNKAFDKCIETDSIKIFEIGRSIIYKRFGISEQETITAELQVA